LINIRFVNIDNKATVGKSVISLSGNWKGKGVQKSLSIEDWWRDKSHLQSRPHGYFRHKKNQHDWKVNKIIAKDNMQEGAPCTLNAAFAPTALAI
jgi:hypothetical protein